MAFMSVSKHVLAMYMCAGQPEALLFASFAGAVKQRLGDCSWLPWERLQPETISYLQPSRHL